MHPAATSLVSCPDTGAPLGDVPVAGWLGQIELDVDRCCFWGSRKARRLSFFCPLQGLGC